MSSTPEQLRMRARFEAVIGLATPALDLVLSVGDRISRVLAPEDDYVPVRAAADRVELNGPRPTAESDR